MHYSINPEEIKTEIQNLGHTVTNIRNIKQYRTKLSLSMFFVELKPALNNKDILNVEYIQQCKIKFEPLKQKGVLLNVKTVEVIGTLKIIAISNREASNAQTMPPKRKI
jgi:hypothetical protein